MERGAHEIAFTCPPSVEVLLHGHDDCLVFSSVVFHGAFGVVHCFGNARSSGLTSLLSDAPPIMLRIQPGRNRRVHCSSLVRRSHHQSFNWSILVRFCTRLVIFPPSTNATVGRNVIPKRRTSSRSTDASRMHTSNFCVSSFLSSGAVTAHTLAHEAVNATTSFLPPL